MAKIIHQSILNSSKKLEWKLYNLSTFITDPTLYTALHLGSWQEIDKGFSCRYDSDIVFI